MSMHYYQSGYRHCSKLTGSKRRISGDVQGSDSDVAELSDLEDDEDKDDARRRMSNVLSVDEMDGIDEEQDDPVDGADNSRSENNSEADSDDDNDNDDEDTGDDDDDGDDDEDDEGNIAVQELPYPGFIPVVLRYLDQNTKPRNWCLSLITNPWFERISMMVILLNCITLGMYQPCVDDKCVTNRCKILQMFDDIIFTFFSLEMTIKMVAMGVYGKGTYLADSWNRLDFFIVAAGALEYCLNVENMNLSAIRTIRVLRPLRAINRIPSMRILVMLLLDTLPMLGNVLLLCFFVFFIFGIIGVQLWEGILRQRCFLKALPNIKYPDDLEKYFEYQGQDYICSRPDDNGMHTCDNLPPLKLGDIVCNNTALPNSNITFITNTTCVNWNYYYTECKGQGNNPFQGTISFDNIGLAWVAIFLVISLEGWTDIMYYVQDAHSFWDWIYFVLLIVIGSFFMINLCLVVIATQFAETKKREMERMRLERARFHSTSTLASSTNNSEPNTCYAEIVKYIGHLWRKGKRSLGKKFRLWKYRRQQRNETLLRSHQQQSHACPNAMNSKIPRYATDEDGRGYHIRCRHFGSAEKCDRNTSNELCENRKSSVARAPCASPEVSETDVSSHQCYSHRTSIRRLPSLTIINSNGENTALTAPETNNALLSPPCTHHRRRSSVMFSDVVMLHRGSVNTVSDSAGPPTSGERINVCSSEKMTQTGDGNIWFSTSTNRLSVSMQEQKQLQPELGKSEAMTCQELLALSGALSAALPTGQSGRDSFLNSLAKGITSHVAFRDDQVQSFDHPEPFPCYCDISRASTSWCGSTVNQLHNQSQIRKFCRITKSRCSYGLHTIRCWIQKLVEHKYFQQGILLAILINTLSMGIEYHNQPEELTVIVEMSNVIFSAIFAVEMLLKVIAEGPFDYISNGFNVFDGIVVILSVVELCQSFNQERGGNSGLSVLRTFRLLRILKLVRFMPNLRRQLFVMLRTMDNVAVFFSLLVLFIFIFSILGMYLFGGKFCMWADRSRPCTCAEVVSRHPMCRCDRKHFNNIVWALVTVFQILTQEDWNVVLFNGMQKTSHWAALYFVALMTFGNYVLFNLLVAILVEGFSSERSERREREQRELAKLSVKSGVVGSEEGSIPRMSDSHSITDSDTYTSQGRKHPWQSVDDLQKYKNNYSRDKRNHTWKTTAINELKCNIQKENKMMGVVGQPPTITHTAATPQDSPNTTLETGNRDLNHRAIYPSNLSIESIDRSRSQYSVTSEYLKPSINNYASNNLMVESQVSKKSNPGIMAYSVRSPAISSFKAFSNSSPSRIRRGYSWRSSRSSSTRRRNRAQSDDERFGNGITVLNNGRSMDGSNSGLCSIEHTAYGGGSLRGSIRNNTQRNATSNRSTMILLQNLSLNPINSVICHTSSLGRCYTTSHQMSYIDDVSRRNSLRNYDTVQARRVLPYDDIVPISKQKSINNLSIDTGALPRIKRIPDESESDGYSSRGGDEQTPPSNRAGSVASSTERIKKMFLFFEPRGCLKERDDYSLYIFPPNNRFRESCRWFVERKWFDNLVLAFIGFNCITLAMERPTIQLDSREKIFLATANYIFTGVFVIEMFVKVVASGMLYGTDAYFTSGWNIMDGALVVISIVDLLMTLISSSSPRIFGILRVFRLLRSLRPLRVINRAPGLKLVVQTLLSSLRPIGNIVLICCTFFIIFGILGVQMFKGTFYYCDGPDIKNVKNKTDCLADKRNVWANRKYNFDDLGKALMSLFVLSSRDGWVNIMYTGLDAVGVDQQPVENYSEWRLLYFIAFILLVGFFVLNMFVGVVVENFHRCREEQEKEERVRRAAKRALQMEKKRRKMHEAPYYENYSKPRLFIHSVCTSKYFDLAIAAVIGLNVVTMAMEFYMMPKALTYILKIFNYFFTAVFILESLMKLLALGFHLYLKDKWNQLDIGIVILSVVGIVLEELESKIIPINPTIIRVMRVLRIARVLKLLKMAKGIRALLDTVMQALPQVGNLGLLFFLLFFIFAALGVELFGRLECTEDIPCQGLGEHAHFSNFGMAFLTLFRVATGDNWNGIMKDTLRDDCDDSTDCVKNCCVSSIIAPIFFVIFVLLAQFVLVNVVIAVLMKHLEESHKQMEDELDMEMQLERELAAEQDELLELAEEEPDENDVRLVESDDDEFDGTIDKNVLVKIRQEGFRRYDNYDLKRIRKFHEEYVKDRSFYSYRPGLSKVRSLPSSFVYNPPSERQIFTEDSLNSITRRQDRRRSSSHRGSRQQNVKLKRRQTFHTQKRGTLLTNVSHFEFKEIRKPLSNLSVPVIIFQKSSSPYGSKYFSHPSSDTESHKKFKPTVQVNKKSANTTNDATRLSFDVPSSSSEKSSIYLLGVSNSPDALHLTAKSRRPDIKEKTKMEVEQDLDVHSVINERRPSKFKINQNSNKNYPDNNQQFSSSQGTNIDESSAVSKMANDNLNDATRSISDLAIQELDKLICKPVRNLEAEIKIYVDEDVEDSSIESTDIRKSISIVVDTSEYVENEGCTT